MCYLGSFQRVKSYTIPKPLVIRSYKIGIIAIYIMKFSQILASPISFESRILNHEVSIFFNPPFCMQNYGFWWCSKPHCFIKLSILFSFSFHFFFLFLTKQLRKIEHHHFVYWWDNWEKLKLHYLVFHFQMLWDWPEFDQTLWFKLLYSHINMITGMIRVG